LGCGTLLSRRCKDGGAGEKQCSCDSQCLFGHSKSSCVVVRAATARVLRRTTSTPGGKFRCHATMQPAQFSLPLLRNEVCVLVSMREAPAGPQRRLSRERCRGCARKNQVSRARPRPVQISCPNSRQDAASWNAEPARSAPGSAERCWITSAAARSANTVSALSSPAGISGALLLHRPPGR